MECPLDQFRKYNELSKLNYLYYKPASSSPSKSKDSPSESEDDAGKKKDKCKRIKWNEKEQRALYWEGLVKKFYINNYKVEGDHTVLIKISFLFFFFGGRRNTSKVIIALSLLQKWCIPTTLKLISDKKR